jgi:hypothetical protein
MLTHVQPSSTCNLCEVTTTFPHPGARRRASGCPRLPGAGTGWVASDPTPPSVQTASASLRTRVAAWLAAALRRGDDVPGGRTGLAVGLLALTALVGAVAVRRRRAPQPGRAAVVHVAGRPALEAFLRFDERLGGRRRGPAESLQELRTRLDVPERVRAALEVVEQECYAAAPPPPAAQATAADVLDPAGTARTSRR